MIDTNQLSALISAFRVETEKESISPELFAARKLHVMIQECTFPKKHRADEENQHFCDICGNHPCRVRGVPSTQL